MQGSWTVGVQQELTCFMFVLKFLDACCHTTKSVYFRILKLIFPQPHLTNLLAFIRCMLMELDSLSHQVHVTH